MSQDANDRSMTLSPSEREAFESIITALNPLSDEARRRLLESAATLLRIEPSPRAYSSSISTTTAPATAPTKATAPFSVDTEMSPKEFLLEKQPRTDVERIACLAYYLTHYRSMPHFKTVDLSLLNTEAAQPKFSNAAYSANNAVKLGYLVPSTKGQRQISAVGERFVFALPDRQAAKQALASFKKKSRGRRARTAANANAEG
jgi:hypothetical protein